MRKMGLLLQSYTLNRSTMSPFSIFALLYITAFFLEMVESWKYPGFTLASFLVVTLIIFPQITRSKFLIFLILSTAYFLLFRFPEVANHVNIIIFCNIVMIVGMIYSFIRHRDFTTDNDYFEMIRPMLRATLILVYFLAGFHKLNSDFLNPEVSCASGMLHAMVSMMKSYIFGIPTALILATGILVIIWKLTGSKLVITPKLRVSTLLLFFCVGGMICGASLIISQFGISTAFKVSVLLAVGVSVILWEFLGGTLLAVPRFQAPVLLYSWTMHSVLAMIGFIDFGALAFSLLFTFVPYSYYQVLNNHANLSLFGIKIHRAHVYFIINAIGGILSGIHFHIYPFLNIKLVSGILLNLASLIFIWPILYIIFLPSRRPVWLGVPVFNRKMPKFMFVFLVFLFLYGMTSYLGLRTAGNFSMFSNLRTEGEVSNHLLLRSNPIKVWDYQEDVVRFIKIDDERAKIGHKYRPLQGNELPVVEFRKLIYNWTKAGYTVPLTFDYRGEIYSTEDIVKDSVWRTDKRNWEMVLMDFRAIQPDRPNQCSW